VVAIWCSGFLGLCSDGRNAVRLAMKVRFLVIVAAPAADKEQNFSAKQPFSLFRISRDSARDKIS